MKDTLYISHNIFLDKEQRYKLYKGKKLNVVGSSFPCWSPESQNKCDCVECFSIYQIIPKSIVNKVVKNSKQGFKIYLKNSNLKSIFNIFSDNKKVLDPDVKNLLDIKDGGKEWMYITENINKIDYNIKHTIEIQKIENLLESFK